MDECFALECRCGTRQECLTNASAYAAGWRLGPLTVGALCPECAGRSDRMARRECVKRHGEAATTNAERMVENLLRGS